MEFHQEVLCENADDVYQVRRKFSEFVIEPKKKREILKKVAFLYSDAESSEGAVEDFLSEPTRRAQYKATGCRRLAEWAEKKLQNLNKEVHEKWLAAPDKRGIEWTTEERRFLNHHYLTATWQQREMCFVPDADVESFCKASTLAASGVAAMMTKRAVSGAQGK
ncbi:MAG: hypothetical protein C5B49_09790 [Bdellovibrio sp.]|nr:MAG: hypothetical protein C5B49_09790 [Bdellovibrio sp.]